jgi:cell division protein FtsW
MNETITLYQRFRSRPQFWNLVGSSLALTLGGLFFLSSASNVISIRVAGNSFHYVTLQLFAIAVGLIALAIIQKFDYPTLRVLASFWVVGTIGLLVAVLFIGKEVGGQRNWIDLGFFNLQPSELAKLAVPAFIAWVAMAANRYRWSENSRWWVMKLGLVAIILLVILERDLGNPIVLGLIGFVSLVIAGMPKIRLLWIAVLSAIGLLALIWFGPSWKFGRISDWLSPENDPMGGGYQLLRGQFALAQGGLTGNGIGSSIEKWGSLPAPHTDFIIPIIGEEFGLLGTGFVILSLGWLIVTAFNVGAASRDMMGKLIGTGFGTWIGFQSVINIGGVYGLMPITGLPLPFISYGGTSMVMMGICLGILFVIERDNYEISELAKIDEMTVA